ncbi:hypothetical protein ACFQ60_43720 [Streptomyces zhihengii]
MRLFLERTGRTLPPGRLSAHSDLTVGVGMASSTADIVAALRCLFRVFALPEDPDAVRMCWPRSNARTVSSSRSSPCT